MTPGLVHTAQWATAAGLGFILLAMACALGLPRTLGLPGALGLPRTLGLPGALGLPRTLGAGRAGENA